MHLINTVSYVILVVGLNCFTCADESIALCSYVGTTMNVGVMGRGRFNLKTITLPSYYFPFPLINIDQKLALRKEINYCHIHILNDGRMNYEN